MPKINLTRGILFVVMTALATIYLSAIIITVRRSSSNQDRVSRLETFHEIESEERLLDSIDGRRE